jgi:hypothetical protein
MTFAYHPRSSPITLYLLVLRCAFADAQCGLVSDEDFWAWVGQELGPDYDVQYIQEQWYSG